MHKIFVVVQQENIQGSSKVAIHSINILKNQT